MRKFRVVALVMMGLAVSASSCQGPAFTVSVGESLRDSITVINSVNANALVTIQAGQQRPVERRMAPYEQHTFLVGSLFSRWDDKIILTATYYDARGRETGCFATRTYYPDSYGRIKEVWRTGQDVGRDDRGAPCR